MCVLSFSPLLVGSIEAPVQIMTGKRERKKTERLVFEEPKAPQDSMKEIKPGRGTKLGEIPNGKICFALGLAAKARS